MKRFLAQLKRRNVPRAAVLYVGAVWALAQGIAQLAPSIGAPEGTTRWFLIAATIGFPFWIVAAWRFELTPYGLRRESDVASNAIAAKQSRRTLDLAISGVLSIAVVLLLTERFARHRDANDPTTAEKALALRSAFRRVREEDGAARSARGAGCMGGRERTAGTLASTSPLPLAGEGEVRRRERGRATAGEMTWKGPTSPRRNPATSRSG
jgi:hypothetical protein